MMEKELKEQILAYSKELRLPTVAREFETLAEESAREKLSYEGFLLRLMEKEYATLEENRRKASIRMAGFPQYKYLHDLHLSDLPEDAASKLPQLERLDFIKKGQNIVMAGNPGTGKTHLAIGLGLKACEQKYKVLFTSVSRLITQVRECRSERTLRALEFKFEKYDLVICDEFGYISFDKEGSELLFSHLSLRCGRKSTIITTNLSFDRWSEIFGDPVLTAAMVDRITHKAYLINMNGKSYRIKETKEWNQQ